MLHSMVKFLKSVDFKWAEEISLGDTCNIPIGVYLGQGLRYKPLPQEDLHWKAIRETLAMLLGRMTFRVLLNGNGQL